MARLISLATPIFFYFCYWCSIIVGLQIVCLAGVIPVIVAIRVIVAIVVIIEHCLYKKEDTL